MRFVRGRWVERRVPQIRWLFAGLALLFFCLPTKSFAYDELSLSIDIAPYASIYVDRNRSLKINDITAPGVWSRFKPLSKPTINLALLNSNLWIRIDLSELKKKENFHKGFNWVMPIGPTHLLKSAVLYIPNGDPDDWHTVETGSDYSEEAVFRFHQLDLQKNTLLLHVTGSVGLLFPIHLMTQRAYDGVMGHRTFFFGLFYGGMIALIIYNFVMFLAWRDQRFHLWFVFFGFFNVLYFLVVNGVLHRHFPWISTHLIFFSLIGFYAFFMVFSRSFLELDRVSPTLDFAYIGLIAINGFMLVFSPFAGARFLNIFTTTAGVASSGLVILTSILLWNKGRAGTRFFVISIAVLIGSGALYSGVISGLLSYNWFFFHSFQVGSQLCALILSLAVTQRIQNLRKSRELANVRIAQHREGEIAAVAAHERLTAILDSLDVLIFVTELSNNNILFKNFAAQKTLDDEMGKSLWETFAANQPTPDPDMEMPTAISGIPLPVEVRRWDSGVLHGDRFFTFHDRIIRWTDGHRVRLTIAIDITEQRRAEKQRQAFLGHLSETQRMESLANMAGGIAHDFNNLLTGITGNLDLAISDLGPDHPAASCIKDSIAAAKLAAVLSSQMLAYSGRGHFQMKRLNLSQFVREWASFLRSTAGSHVRLKFNLDENLPDILADPGQLQQVLVNVVVNAAEAIGKAEGTIDIVTKHKYLDDKYFSHCQLADSPVPGEYVTIQVWDNGNGIRPENIKRIFEPFFTTKFTGRGLGLAAVHGILRGHKGAICVDSKVGEGSEFEICFPVSKGDVPVRNEDQTKTPGTALHGNRILVVEDEPLVMNMIAKAMEKFSVTMTSAANGDEALEKFSAAKGNFDAIVMDLTMPGISAADVLAEIKKFRADLPILLISGYPKDEAFECLSGKKVEGFLQKPFTPGKLADALKEVLQNKQA